MTLIAWQQSVHFQLHVCLISLTVITIINYISGTTYYYYITCWSTLILDFRDVHLCLENNTWSDSLEIIIIIKVERQVFNKKLCLPRKKEEGYFLFIWHDIALPSCLGWKRQLNLNNGRIFAWHTLYFLMDYFHCCLYSVCIKYGLQVLWRYSWYPFPVVYCWADVSSSVSCLYRMACKYPRPCSGRDTLSMTFSMTHEKLDHCFHFPRNQLNLLWSITSWTTNHEI